MRQIVLKSMHYCTSDGRDKSGWTHRCTHIHRTKIVTTMSRLPASGLHKNCKYSLDSDQGPYMHTGMYIAAGQGVSATTFKCYSQ